MALHFHSLPIARSRTEAAGAAVITFAVPPALREQFSFRPGQFLTLRTRLAGNEERRSYSICSTPGRYRSDGEIEVAIKPVADGSFSRWAVAALKAGDTLEVMPPEGRFTPSVAGARHRVGFAAGSGITPLLAIAATALEEQPDSRFTLVYGNQRIDTIMFGEALQDLKDRHPARLTLIHVLSRQPQETALFNGRIDQAKVAGLLATLLPVQDIDEAFLCGPEGMIDGAERALLAAGLAPQRLHAERFFTDGALAAPAAPSAVPGAASAAPDAGSRTRLHIVMDGKTHGLTMGPGDRVLDVALAAGLDLPYSCKGGVCCTCRARVLEGRVEMDRNYTLEQWEIDRGFVLTCQARPLTDSLTVSYDER